MEAVNSVQQEVSWSYRQRRLYVYFIALVAATGGMLFGYDLGVISGALLFVKNSISLTTIQTELIVGAVFLGGLIGTLFTGPLADKMGRRTVVGLSSVVFISGILTIIFSQSFYVLLTARILLGIGIAIVSVAVPLYTIELAPTRERGRIVTLFQLFITGGILLSYLIDLIFIQSENWRAMFAIILFPATTLLISIFFLPESARWLVTQNRISEAKLVLKKTRCDEEANRDLLAFKNSLHQSSGTWRELFSSKLLLPLFIAVSIAFLQQMMGINSFLQYAPLLLHQAGLNSNTVAMLGSVGIGLLNFVTTIIALFLVDRVGRRPLLLWGLIGIIAAELFLGGVSYSGLMPQFKSMMIMIGLFFFIVFYAVGPGVVVWLVMSELFPTKVRGKGLGVCLFFNSLAAWILASSFMSLQKHLGTGGIYWFCAAFAFLYFLIVKFLYPETKANSLEEIQQSFINNKQNEVSIPLMHES